ncbi:serine hydrolase [Streptomyces sp. NBC_00249]|uniref:D-alanyl-D-alanine carboxypeptidase n=1 Tax=Streptomyces sp. NBC_00249 TaxID=2975690 RepID=UPI00224D5E02|nr:serine hydrolase [Streptomyces sp. NBC_00249]MCX5195264.1 serine hydrolase [Streptomyces sp. NBC_00249]
MKAESVSGGELTGRDPEEPARADGGTGVGDGEPGSAAESDGGDGIGGAVPAGGEAEVEGETGAPAARDGAPDEPSVTEAEPVGDAPDDERPSADAVEDGTEPPTDDPEPPAPGQDDEPRPAEPAPSREDTAATRDGEDAAASADDETTTPAQEDEPTPAETGTGPSARDQDAAAEAPEAEDDEAPAEPRAHTAAPEQAPDDADAPEAEDKEAPAEAQASSAAPEEDDADAAAPEQDPDEADATGSESGEGPAEADVPEAEAEERDAERTSTFRALKDLGRPTAEPAPAPAPEPPVVEATRESPLPPLELLAELTNTAPPPETPRRTLTRRVKVWTPIVLLLAGAVAGVQLLRPLPDPQLVGAQDTYTLDGATPIPWPAKGQAAVRIPGSGDIGTFGEQKPMPTASVAKVMTAYVILRDHPLLKNEPGPRITIDAKAVADGASEHESRIESLTEGATFSQLDMLKMMMIPSANNISRLLARWDTGTDSEAAFVAKMNAAAKELGMDDTTYTDPSGLDAGTVSTAADQLKLAEAVMREEAFRAVVALPSATIEGLPGPIINNNDLLLAPGLSFKGIKTGSSTPAGGTLMWAAYKTIGEDTQLVLGTMMDQHVDGPDPDGANSLKLVKENSRKVLEAVRTALGSTLVVRKGQVVGHVSDGLGGRTPLVATRDLSVIGVPGQKLRFSVGARPGAKGDPVPHEAKAGTQVGVLTVGTAAGGQSVPVAVGKPLKEPSFVARVTRGS